MTYEDDTRLHSELGASGAHRWRPCPGSVALVRGLPDKPSMDAAEGTVFHEVASWCLELGLEPHGFVGALVDVPPFGPLPFTAEMANHMLAGLDYLWAIANQPGVKLYVEERLDLSAFTQPGEFGTTDATLVDLEGLRMVVFDWKYGAGVPVHPERNDQAIIYGLGAWHTFAADLFHQRYFADWEVGNVGPEDIQVDVVIEQPRAPGGGGVWRTTMAELLAESRKIAQDAARTQEPDAPLVPGEKQCRFCRAAQNNVCEARARFLLDLAGADFDSLEDDFGVGLGLDLRRALTPEQRSQVLLHRKMIEQYLDQLHTEAYHDAEKGRSVPGMKLILGRSPKRTWKDEAKAKTVLRARLGQKAFHPPKLLSPAQVEETVGRKHFREEFSHHVRPGQGSPILVPEDQPGEPISTPEDDFDMLNDLNDNVI